MDTLYTSRFWESPDGLKLHYRHYQARNGAGDQALPIVCMHGLTRNSRDFSVLAKHLSERHTVLVPEMRGRGQSEYAKDFATYNPLAYVSDVEALLAKEGIERFIAVGTSLGGLMTMLMAFADADRLAGVVLNDIGPEIDPEGIARIREYVGQGRSYPSWMHAARALEEEHASSFPAFVLDDWLEMAKRGMVVQQNGRIAFDYDMNIAEPFQDDDGAAPPNLWPALEALSATPVLIVRGALSDLLTEKTMADMLDRLPGGTSVTVPEIGHAPLLEEDLAIAAIDTLVAQAI